METINEPLLKKILCDTMSVDELEALVERTREEMRKQAILKKYDIKQFNTGASAGKWYVKIDGKKVQSISKEDLENKIVKMHRDKSPSASKTFKAVFQSAHEDKLKRVKDPNKIVSAQNTTAIYQRTYKKYITGTHLEDMQINRITDSDINTFLDNLVLNNDVKEKAFKNLITVFNITFKYAIKKKFIPYSPMNGVFIEDYADSFAPSTPISERGYTSEQMFKMREEAIKMQQEQPEDARWWSYEFNLLTAERRAEIPPIRWSDVYLDDNIKYIDIHQQLIGKKPFFIKPSSKNGLDRYFPVDDLLEDFLTRLKNNNDIYHPDSEFLFPDEQQELGCITPYVTYRAHVKICKKLGIPIDRNVMRGTHAFRRNHQTSFLEEGGSIELAAKVYGNSPNAIDNHYRLKMNSSISASIVAKTHEKLFKNKGLSDK